MKKILVVVDMQKDFITGSLGTEEAKKIVPNVVKLIDEFDGEIYATLDTHDEDYLNTLEGKKLPVVHCQIGTDGWHLADEVEEALAKKQVTMVEKPTFGSVELMGMLEDEVEDDEVEFTLCGLCTDICVVTNSLLLRAYFPNAVIKVKADCCAGVTPETHEAALKTMQMCQIDII